MKLLGVLLVLAFSSCAAPQPDSNPRRPVSELADRKAGTAEQCVVIQRMDSLRISDSSRHTLLYGSGKVVWVNNLPGECTFGSNDVLVTEPTGSQYCRGDIVRSFDRTSRIPGPSCALGDFVPYTR